MYNQGTRGPQFKFNNLFNKYFPSYFLFNTLSHTNWRRRGGGGLLFKVGVIDG